MGDLENAVHAARVAQGHDQEIDDATARVIASLYHEGQASVSYSFVSTGAIVDPTSVYREMFPNYDALAPDEKLLASMFGTYLHNRPDRGPVAGWSRIWLTSTVRGEERA
jgi:hypothetical protein